MTKFDEFDVRPGSINALQVLKQAINKGVTLNPEQQAIVTSALHEVQSKANKNSSDIVILNILTIATFINSCK